MAICDKGIDSVSFADNEQDAYYSVTLGDLAGEELEQAREKALQETVDVHAVDSSEYAPYIVEGFTGKQHIEAKQGLMFAASEMMKHKVNSDDHIQGEGVPEPYVTKNVKAGLRNKIQEYESREENERAEDLQNVLDNFELLWQQVRKDFEDIGLSLQNGSFYPQSGTLHDRHFWEDMGRFQQSSKETASSNVKMSMSFIPKVEFQTDENGVIERDEDGNPKTVPKRNYLGMQSFYRMSEVWNLTAHVLADEFPRTPENFLSRLREVGDYNSTVFQVWKKMSSQPEKIKRDFTTALGKHYATFRLIYANRRGNNFEMRPIRSDRISREQALLSKWRDDIASDSSIGYRDENGVYRVDQDQVQNIKNRLEEISENMDRSSNEYRNLVQRALSSLGIDLSGEFLRAAQEGEANLDRNFDFEFGQLNQDGEFKSGSFLGRTFEALLEPRIDEDGNEIEGDPRVDQVNPAENATSAAALQNIARRASLYETQLWAPSFTDVENSRLYALQDHEPLTVNLARLHDFDGVRRLSRDPFREHSVLVRKLMGIGRRDPISDDTLPNSEEDMGEIDQGGREALLEAIEFGYVDGVSVQGQREGQTIDNLAPRDHSVEKIAFFQNQGRDRRIFQGPTLSDKSRSYTLHLPSYQSHYGESFWDVSIEVEGDEAMLSIPKGQGLAIKEALYDAALSEISRISHIQDWLRNNNAENHPLGEAYAEGAQLFYLFPELNEHNISNEERRSAIWQDDGTFNDPRHNQESREAIREILIENVLQDVQNEYSRWKREGLDNSVNRQYIRSQTPHNPGSEKAVMYSVLDQYVNYRAFYTDALRLLHFDPAEASKWQEDQSPEDTVRLTLDNFQKRLGGSMSPGMSHGMPENETFSKATLLDREVSSKFKEDHREVFKNTVGVDNADAFDNIESTDAQEYVTLEEYLRVSLAYGQISKDLHDQIQRRLRASRKLDRPFRLRKQELDQILFQPHKPRYFGQKWDSDLGQMIQVYTKSSAFPLIPQFTKGTQLDELRQKMEEKGIDRVSYLSADKVGAKNPGQIYDSNGDIDPDTIESALSQSRQELPRSGFGLQFLVPHKKDEIRLQTQFNKLFMTDMVEADGIDAESIWERKENIRRQMFDIKRQQLEERLGAELTDSGEYKLDPNRLRDLLLEEAERRDYSPVFKEEIRNLTDGDIESILSFTGAASQIESLLLSLVKDVVRPQMHGRSYVQQSSAGVEWENANEAEHIAFAPDFDPESGLDFMHTEDGEVQAAEIVVAWHFKDDNGDPIPMEDFVTRENGKRVLDMDRIEDELLSGIGQRIPFQGPNSMVPTKIVGFLPPEYGVQAFVPDDIITQMGSDFDVDKLYTYLRSYKMEDGNLVGIDENASELDKLREEYLSTIEDVLYNPSDEVQAQIRKPLDQSDLKDEIGRIEEQIGRRSRGSFTHFRRQTDDYINQKTGKDLIGITSLWSQLEAILQHHDVEYTPGEDSSRATISARVRSPGSGSRVIELNRAGGPAEISSETSGRISLQDAIRLFQNAAVDNAKENVLGPLGITTQNAGIAMHMLLMNNGERGLDLEHVTRLMNQPIIREVLREADRIQSIFSSESPFGAVSRAIENVIESERSADNNTTIPLEGSELTLPPASPVPGSNEPNLLEDLNPDYQNQAWRDRQIEYLRIFQELNKQVKDMEKVRDAFMFGDRRGPGSSLIAAKDRYDKIYDLPLDRWEGLMDVGGDLVPTEDNSAGKVFQPDTELGHATESSVGLAHRMFYRYFGYGNADFEKTVRTVEEMSDRDLSATEKERIFKEYRGFVMTGAFKEADTELNESVTETRRRLLFGNEEQADLASRILEARAEGWGRDRLILEFMDVTPADEDKVIEMKDGSQQVIKTPAQVDFRYMKMEDMDEMRLLHSVAEMLSSPRDVERELMRDISLYTIISRGWTHSPSTMADLIPPQFLNEIGITSALRDMKFEGEEMTLHESIFETQYIQHHPSRAYNLSDDEISTLPGPSSHMRPSFSVKNVLNNAEEYVEKTDIQVPPGVDARDHLERKLRGVAYNNESGETIAKPYISQYDQSKDRYRLWEHVGNMEYQEIPVLGSATGRTNVDLEYNPSTIRANSDILPQEGVKRVRHLPKEASKNTPEDPVGFQAQENRSGFGKYVQVDPRYNDGKLINALKNINRDSDLPEHVLEVSRVLTKLSSEELGNTTVEVVNNPDMSFEGGFSRGDNHVVLNRAHSSQDPGYHAKVTIHEAIHAATNSKIQSYLDVQNGEISRSESRLTDLQFRALSDLDSLRDIARNRIVQEIKESSNYSVSQIIEWTEEVSSVEEGRAISDLPQDAQFYVNRMYNVSNIREFASALMSEDDFQSWAAEQEVDGEVSVAQRFARIIQRVIRAMAEELGINTSRPTLLSRGVESVILSVGFDQNIQQGSSLDSDQVVSRTPYNNVEIVKLADGSRKVVNNKGNTLNQDTQERILEQFDQEKEEQNEAPRDPTSGAPNQQAPPSGLDPTDIDQSIPAPSDIETQIEGQTGHGRRDMEGTVGEFIQSLNAKQRRTFRRLRNQIRTRCD